MTDVCCLKHLRAELWEGHFPYSLSETRHKEGLALTLLILEKQPASAAHGGETKTCSSKLLWRNMPQNLQCCWTIAALDTRPSFSCSSPISHPLSPQPGQPSGFSVAMFSSGRKVRLTSPFIPISLYASPILSFCSDCRQRGGNSQCDNRKAKPAPG